MAFVLVDTNILLRSAEPAHPMHAKALDSQATLRLQGEQPCLVTQNLIEFRAVATRPANVNGLGMSQAQANMEIARLKQIYPLFADTPAIFAEWERLVSAYVTEGRQNHDARIVAAMIVHGITRILTFDDRDFVRYSEISVESPDEVLSKASP